MHTFDENEDIEHLEDMLFVYNRRVRFFEKKEAMYGPNITPEDAIQIEDLRGRLEIPATNDTHYANVAFLRAYGRS
jgi:hypothetical protein